jgi:arsenate reductase
MESKLAIEAFAALAHETRLAAFRLLMVEGPDGLAAGVIAERLGAPASTLSFHLAHLERAHLLVARRLGKQILYAVDQAGTRDLIDFLMRDCCGGNPALCAPTLRAPTSEPEGIVMADRVFNVLFLCTANSARSVLAEVLLGQRWGKGRFQAFSAGSHPRGEVNPAALATLERAGLETGHLRSKSWDEFAAPGAPALDFVFTVCDNAAGEVCPIWPGQPMTAHWGIPDPADVTGDAEAVKRAFWRAMMALEARIKLFTSLPLASIDRLSLQNRLRDIGAMGEVADVDPR